MKEKILVLEDEIGIRSFVSINLKREGYEIIEAGSGQEAIEQLSNHPDISIALLDVMLPDIDGFRICQKIREQYYYPIIMLTAKVEDTDKIMGLTIGADDYITKPYSSKELVLRVNNIIKRVYKKEEKTINYETYQIDLEKRVVYKDQKQIKLTTLEFDLLILFLKNINKGFSRDEILNYIWGDDYFGTDRVVDDLVRRLRKKMPKLNINAIYGYGYRMSWKIKNKHLVNNLL